MVQLTVTSVHTKKDQLKSDKATQFIGIGAVGSSTYQYAKDWGDKANTGVYTASDKVFVSINGKRRNRKGIQYIRDLLDKAIEANVTFITDNWTDRNRDFNIGEREVVEYLVQHGYQEIGFKGHWVKH